MPQRNNDQPEEQQVELRRPPFYFEQPLHRRIHHIYLSGMIGPAEYYVDMIHIIRSAPPEDMIHLHLNTPGGHLGTGVQLINAMRNSNCPVICSLEAEAHSLGTLIFLAADEWIVHDHCMMMFHTYSGGAFGKGHEQKAQIEASSKMFEELAKDIYVPFLTDEEVDAIIRGEDKWLHTDDIRKRLEKMVKNLEKERKAAEKAAKTG